MLGVQPEYLDAARATIEREYGGLRGYLETAGVTDEDVKRLRAALSG